MKLPIKQKYFDKIKSGEKIAEYRDAHITFVCEETGEILQLPVTGVEIIAREDVPEKYRDVLEDDQVIMFRFGLSYAPEVEE